MAEIVRMPKLSDTMTEGVVTKWHKNIGDQVKEGDLLAEIETDKATMEFESYVSGVLLHRGVKEGVAAEVDTILAILGEKGENFESLLSEEQTAVEPNIPVTTEEQFSEAVTQNSDSLTTAVAPDIKAQIIAMPKLSDTMTEGVVAKWHKKVGDKVKNGDLLAEIETDKATMEFESYEEGELLYVGVSEGDSAAVDSILAIVGEKNADYKALIDFYAIPAGKKKDPTPAPEKTSTPSVSATISPPPASVNLNQENGRVKISPLARKMAEERGISIRMIKGSGDGGRIIKRDVEEYNSPGVAFSGSLTESFTDVAVSQMRKTIAKRLTESKFTAPHFYLTISLDMDQAISARTAINESIEGKISFNDLIIKAAAIALKKHPRVNVAWMGDSIRMFEHVHIGVAVAVEEGLLVPVIRHANAKSFQEIGNEVKNLAEKARNKTLQPQEWEGSTFTISNLGMFGIDEFTAIINPPNACILAVGGIQQIPVVKNNQIVPGNVMKVTLSCDHRVVDGATGSEFLATFKKLVENPITMFV